MLLSSSHCLYIEFKYMPRDLVYCPCGSIHILDCCLGVRVLSVCILWCP